MGEGLGLDYIHNGVTEKMTFSGTKVTVPKLENHEPLLVRSKLCCLFNKVHRRLLNVLV